MNYFPQFYQPMQNPNMMQNMPQAQNTQTNGIISAPNEEFARNYPVAYGNSVTFRDESLPYIYTKTMGFSQMDRPTFDKYKLVKEGVEEVAPTPVLEPKDYDEDIAKLKSDIEILKTENENLKTELEDLSDALTALKKRVSGTKKVNNDG